MSATDIVLPLLLIGGAGIGAMLLIRHVQTGGPKSSSDGSPSTFAGAVAHDGGYQLGDAGTQFAGGVAQAYHNDVESGFCSGVGQQYDPKTGNCVWPDSVGPFTRSTPLLGGLIWGGA